MTAGRTEAARPARLGHAAHLWVYVAAGMVGYALGVGGVFPLELVRERSSPLARLGYALEHEGVQASDQEWQGLKADFDRVRFQRVAYDPNAFELVVALRGLANGGNGDLARAEEACRALKWPRCDRPALEEMKRRSRP